MEICEDFSQTPSTELYRTFNEKSRDFYSHLQEMISLSGKSEQYLPSLRKGDQLKNVYLIGLIIKKIIAAVESVNFARILPEVDLTGQFWHTNNNFNVK